MAAEVLATSGVAVTVYEHMPSVGRKLLLAGRSGLNVTNSEPIEQLLGRYGTAREVLAPAIESFDVDSVRSWSAGLDEPTFVGSTGHVFPKSFRATPLLRTWLTRLAALDVKIEVRRRWIGWPQIDHPGALLESPDGTITEIHSDVTILALGGASWPRVGSDGTWVDIVRRAGVDVSSLRPANCGIEVEWTQHFRDRFAGVPIKNIAISVGEASVRGDAMITRGGLEGGPVYTQSARIRDAIDQRGRSSVEVDLHPDLDAGQLAERLARRRPKDSIATTLRRTIGLTPVEVSLMREVAGDRLSTDSDELAALVKALPLVVTSTMPIDRAISTAGGIALHEVDAAFMLHRYPGTFVAGEMLDWEAPTGGYLLQATFSTAVAAANGALRWLGVRASNR
jgi:hypothetical protein